MSGTRHGIDLTEGRISAVLIRFATPFVIANLVTSLYGVIGMLVIGRYTDRATIAGVATGTMIMNLTFSIIFGIGTGGTVLIGRCIGERNKQGGTKATGSFFVVAVIVITALTLVIWSMREVLLDLLKIQPEARPSASRYVMICTLGIPFNVGYGMISAVFRAMGNSKAPSLVAAICCIVNIAMSFILVLAAGLAEAGVAIAVVVAQFLSIILLSVMLYRIKLPFPFAARDIRPDRKSVGFIFTVGLPIVLQELLVGISFLVITNRVNSISVEAAASVGVVGRTFTIAYVIPNALASAVAAMTAQNLGAGRHDRAISSMRWGIFYALIIESIIFTVCTLRPEAVVSIFATDEVVIRGASTYLRSNALEALTISFVFCMNSYLSGYGKSKVAMAHTIFSVVCFRVPLSIFVSGLQGIELNTKLAYLGLCGPAASFVSLIVCIVYIAWQQKHREGVGEFRM